MYSFYCNFAEEKKRERKKKKEKGGERKEKKRKIDEEISATLKIQQKKLGVVLQSCKEGAPHGAKRRAMRPSWKLSKNHTPTFSL